MSGNTSSRALALVSGGLDSLLAVRILSSRGVSVEAVHFRTGFDRPAHVASIARERREAGSRGHPLCVETLDVRADFLREVLTRPVHGFGAAMNPCLDCRIFMLRRAASLADARGIRWLATGEVVGQNPMTGRHAALGLVEREAGVEGRLLRPLSASHLPPTEAERLGEIERSWLGRFHGRSRSPQRGLARELGLSELAPAGNGCCVLADRGFAPRVRDLLDHRDRDGIRPRDVARLRLGRHFRLGHAAKAIVSRNADEEDELRALAGDDWIAHVADGLGALAVIEGEPGDPERERAAALVAWYGRSRGSRTLVRLRKGAEELQIEVLPRPPLDRERV